jgi:hypothetical protein
MPELLLKRRSAISGAEQERDFPVAQDARYREDTFTCQVHVKQRQIERSLAASSHAFGTWAAEATTFNPNSSSMSSIMRATKPSRPTSERNQPVSSSL